MLYNKPYIAMASRKHPEMMGARVEICWAEIAKDLEPIFLESQQTGRATTMEANFFLQRHGYLEETFFSYDLIPIRADNGSIDGFYIAGFETTRHRIWERRTST